ncbi:MAG: N-6 DNA methylase [Candidatus Latescibacteria bacterium]|nr:N-6 DNA methylase [Candidatus Latescibacterota bacterium]
MVFNKIHQTLGREQKGPAPSRGGNALARRDRAQYFTPEPVARFMWEGLQRLGGMDGGQSVRMIDPAAGEGVFLRVGRLEGAQVHGIEIDPGLVAGSAEADLCVGDGLLGTGSQVPDEGFDLVLGNPPFGRLGTVTPPEQIALWEQTAGWPDCFGIWRAGRIAATARTMRGAALDQLFVERALQLARPGGWVAFVLPEGFFANGRTQAARDWILQQATVRAVVRLPGDVFAGAGGRVQTAVLFLHKGGQADEKAILVGQRPQSLQDCLQHGLQCLGRQRSGATWAWVQNRRLLGQRWDAGYWLGRRQRLAVDHRRFALQALGDFIEHLTYGPIITGRRPSRRKGDVPIIHQGAFAAGGLRLEEAVRVPAGSPYDPQKSRVQQGDLLLPRSGAGALGRNRLAVYMEEGPANIGCFVDLVRLRGLNPFYAWFFFKTQPGWQQIRALINGVGTPNINFSEIRSLRIAAVPQAIQRQCEQRYRRDVLPWHIKGDEQESQQRFQIIVEELEAYLAGRRDCLRGRG